MRVDATHSPSFHQIEGLVIDKEYCVCRFEGTLAEFARELFGEETKVKIPPLSFPVHRAQRRSGCDLLQSAAARAAVSAKAPAGLKSLAAVWVHPRVLQMSGIDPRNIPVLHSV